MPWILGGPQKALGFFNLPFLKKGSPTTITPAYVDFLPISNGASTNSKSVTLPAGTKSAFVTTHLNSNSNANRIWDSITIDGNAATKVVAQYSGDDWYSSENAIWAVNNLSAGSVTFAGTKSGTSGSYHSVAHLVALNVSFNTFVADDSAAVYDTSSPMSVNCDSYSGGLIIGAWQCNNSATPGITYLSNLNSNSTPDNQKGNCAWLVPASDSLNQLIDASEADSFHRSCTFAVASFKASSFS